ncbi:hypothetical protein GFS31_43850 (plasmid) [Leptolyngbya sp. BL0902]|nr:hypothetical protein GFS31_43850 [Leptolyngbya sp. BL0902]
MELPLTPLFLWQRLFQSLRGFGVDWSAIWSIRRQRKVLFQSLRGFGVDWSPIFPVFFLGSDHVSIPERVWGGLERNP